MTHLYCSSNVYATLVYPTSDVEKSKIYDAFVLLLLSCSSNVYAALVYPTSDVEKREKKKNKNFDAFVLLYLSCSHHVYATPVHPTSDVEKREKNQMKKEFPNLPFPRSDTTKKEICREGRVPC
jgi:hypothetical protein